MSLNLIRRAALACGFMVLALSNSTRAVGTAQVPAQPSSPALRLWREVEPLFAARNETAARRVISGDVSAARALYRELLFDAVDSRLYNNPPLSPNADALRALLLTEADAEGVALEAKFAAWSKERKLGEGFTGDGVGLEKVLYSYIAAETSNTEKQKVDDGAKPLTQRDLTERALKAAETAGSELAVACSLSNLGFYALRERRFEDARQLLERAELIFKRWKHPVGVPGVSFRLAETYDFAENWKEAARLYERAANLAKELPALQPLRVAALAARSVSLRNSGDREGARAALAAAVEEQQRMLDAATDESARVSRAKRLADLQTQLGGAAAALSRHAEAGEWYARADRLRAEVYPVERAQFEAQLADLDAKIKARLAEPGLTEATRTIYLRALETAKDTLLSVLDYLARDRNDLPARAAIAERRLTIAREGGSRENIANSLDEVARAHLAAGDFLRARSAAEEALKLRSAHPRRAYLQKTVYLLGQIAHEADDWREAEARFREVIELAKPDALPPPVNLEAEPREDLRRIQARINSMDRFTRVQNGIYARLAMAEILAHKGNYGEADQEYAKVSKEIPLVYASGAEDESDLIHWIDERGGKASASGEVLLTREIRGTDVAARRSATGFKPSDAEIERLQLAELLANSLRATVEIKRASLLEDQGDLDRAAKAYEAAIVKISNVLGGSFPLVGAQIALARIERERGNYAAAEAPLLVALAEYQRKHDPSGVAGVLAQQSVLRREQGRIAEARLLAEDALKIARTLGSRQQTAGMLRTLGRVESEQGGAALQASERHLRESLNIWRGLELKGHVAYTLSSLGLTLERLHREAEALAAYEEAVKLIESLTTSLSIDVSADIFNSSRANRELYERLIKLLIKRGRAGDALHYLERAKSKALVDALAGAQVNSKDPALNALLERARSLRDSVRIAETALATELAKSDAQRDPAGVADARARVTSAQKQYTDTVEQIKRANPSYASLVAVNPTNLAEVRERLPEKTLLLSYFPTETDLYIFVVTHEQAPAVRTVSVSRTEIAALVAEYRRALKPVRTSGASARGLSLAEKDGKEAEAKPDVVPKRDIKDSTVKLYDVLFKPVQAEVDRAETIILVPAAELYYLPIHALGRMKEDGSIAFLIEQKRFAYLASADLLKVVTNTSAEGVRTKGVKTESILALGNPDGSLPGATEEVSTLGRLFPKADVYTGEDATVSRVTRSSAARVPYIHFATHGVINSLDPKESFLLLAGEPDRLSVKDIVEDTYKLSFEGARLVTLSACDTNIGGWDPSAVYSSLSRAFSKAGAPAVIASLWSVSDASTRDTMAVFYRELAAGNSKAEAMRRAQLAVMRDPRFAHPFFWAPFVILGEWR